MKNVTVSQLKQAVELQTKIEFMQKQLQTILDGGTAITVVEKTGKRKFSAKARAAIAAGQKKRWEAFHATKQAASPVTA